MVKTPLELVTEFHEEFGLAVRSSPFFIDGDELELRKTLITEEYKEVIEALDGDDLENVAKELADLAYVVYGTATQMGIDLDTVLEEVHRSNMSKIWPDGTIKRRFDGKIMKPDTYSQADIKSVLGLE